LNDREQVLRLKAPYLPTSQLEKPNVLGLLHPKESSMTKIKLLSAGLIATAMLAMPAMARENYVAKRHVAEEANASASPTVIDGRGCIPAPRVGAFATEPWGGDNVPCEPESH
jgi:hypothetical protein